MNSVTFTARQHATAPSVAEQAPPLGGQALVTADEATLLLPARRPSPLTPHAIDPTAVVRAMHPPALRTLRATCRYWRDRVAAEPLREALSSIQRRWASTHLGVDGTIAAGLGADAAAVQTRVRVAPETRWSMIARDWSMFMPGSAYAGAHVTGNKRLMVTDYRCTALFDGMRGGEPRWARITVAGDLAVSDCGQFAVGMRPNTGLGLWERIPRGRRKTGLTAHLEALVRVPPDYVLRAERPPFPGGTGLTRQMWLTSAGTRDTVRVVRQADNTLSVLDSQLHTQQTVPLSGNGNGFPWSVGYHAPSQTFTATWRGGHVATVQVLGASPPVYRETRLPPGDVVDSRVTLSGNRLITRRWQEQERGSQLLVHDLTSGAPTPVFEHAFTDKPQLLSSDADGQNVALRSERTSANGRTVTYKLVLVDVRQKQVRSIDLQRHDPLAVHWADTIPALGAVELRDLTRSRTRVLLFRPTRDADIPYVYSVLREEQDAFRYQTIGFDAAGRHFFQYGRLYRERSAYGPSFPSELRIYNLTEAPDA